MDAFPDRVQIFSCTVHEFYANAEGNEGVAEFTISAKVVPTGYEYNQHYISLMKSRGRKFTLYRVGVAPG
jgi:ketosteroid isomerase-like protein